MFIDFAVKLLVRELSDWLKRSLCESRKAGHRSADDYPNSGKRGCDSPRRKSRRDSTKTNSGIVNSFPGLFIFLQNEPVMLDLIRDFFFDSAYLSQTEIEVGGEVGIYIFNRRSCR